MNGFERVWTSSQMLFPIDRANVDGGRTQSHYSSIKYSPAQLRMMLPFFALQKMSGQVVSTHPPKLLLVWQSSILIFLGPFLGMLTPFSWLGRQGPFIMSRASSLWRWEGSLTFAIMIVLRGWQSHHYPTSGWQRLLGGWFIVILVFSLCRRRRGGRSRSLEKT